MIVECPECNEPFQLLEGSVAPLVQVACPACRFRMILDFAAANDAALQEEGMGIARGFASAEAYRLAAGSSPARPSAAPFASPSGGHAPVSPPSPAAAWSPTPEPAPATTPSARHVVVASHDDRVTTGSTEPIEIDDDVSFEDSTEDQPPELPDLDLSDLDDDTADAEPGVPSLVDESLESGVPPTGTPLPVDDGTSAQISRRREVEARQQSATHRTLPLTDPPQPPPTQAPPRGRYRGGGRPPPPPREAAHSAAAPPPPPMPGRAPALHGGAPPVPAQPIAPSPAAVPGPVVSPRAPHVPQSGRALDGGSHGSHGAYDSLSTGVPSDSMLQRMIGRRGPGTYLLVALVLLIVAVLGLSFALHGTLNPQPLFRSLLQ